MRLLRLLCLSGLVVVLAFTTLAMAQEQPGVVMKKGLPLDIRSQGKQIADDVARNGSLVTLDAATPVPGVDLVPQVQFRRGNVQTNDPALDNIQDFPTITPATRPFFSFTQSETSIAGAGRNIVATYNSSANQPITQVGNALFFIHRFLSGYSISNDGGQTWTSGFFPPLPGSIFTFGDPSVGVDRKGNFFFAGLGANSNGLTTIQVNRSTDGGRTWSDAVLVQQDNGGDKEWLAVGPDPNNKNRDNVYVTWTSFQPGATQLRFGKSTDGGVTFTSKTIFTPTANPDPTFPQNALQFSNPYVDPKTGALYVPFLQFSNSDLDFIRILASTDGGDTFSFLPFNVPGAPLTTVLPIVQVGHLVDCGNSGGTRLSIHAGTDIGGRFGLSSYVNAARLVTQPAFAARNGVLYLAWNNSTSPLFADPNSGSNIHFVRSDDGGQTWTTPIQVNPTAADDPQHVLPSLSIDSDANDVHVLYYTQHSDGTIDVDMANSHNRGQTFPGNRTVRVTSTSAGLPPTNIPLSPPAGNSYNTTNYDRTIRPCYSLGEYLSASAANGRVYALWGDTRNTVSHPVNPNDPLSGQTHAQQDVFFQIVKAQ